MSPARRSAPGTFSITAVDDATGRIGVAVTSKAFSVGTMCPFAAAAVGGVATQAFVNPLLGPAILDALASGSSPTDALERALAGDPQPDLRQLNVVDAHGASTTFTGTRCLPWCGGRAGRGYALAGNILVGERVVDAMERAWLSLPGGDFADRLIRTLEAGQSAGGDARGKQSAALLIVHLTPVPALRLQVDDHAEPLAELRRLYTLATEPDPDDGLSMLDFTSRPAGDPAWIWPVDDDQLEAERRRLQR